jgi:hypothetical protein
MGLVRNLKKRLNNLVDKVLAELCYLYILQKARQTTKRQGNYSITMSLQSPLTTVSPSTIIATSSQDTSEKIIMKTLKTTEDIVAHIRDWSVDKIEEVESIGDKAAIYAEFEEWIELDVDDEEEIEIVSLESEED